MTKQGYIRNQKILQNRIIAKYLNPVYRALYSQVIPYINLVKSHGVQVALARANADIGINHQIGPVIKALYNDAAKLAEPKLRINKGLIQGFIQNVLDYFAEFLFEKVVLPITQTTMKNIRDALNKSIEEGWGFEKTVSELKNLDILKSRARMIVRTESVRAMNYAQLKAADNEKYEVIKTWIAIEDKRTRIQHTHAGVDGEVRDLYTPFSNNLLFPGDPEGPPEQTINCRCTMGYTFKTDLEGNFIRKENISNIG